MTIIEEIIAALLLSNAGDLRAVRQYIGWMKFRRLVNNHFYTSAHWVKQARSYHWIG